MRKFLCILILTLSWLVSNGQTGPVFQYTHPSKQTLLELALSKTIEGYVYRNYLVEKINLGLVDTTVRVSRANIISIFEHMFLEEVYLKEGSYMNSGYNPLKTKMDPSVGHEWTGFAWVFRMGTYVIIIIKEDCGNILTVPVIRKVIFVPQPRPEPRPDPTPDWRTYQAPKKVYPNQPPPPPPPLPLIIKSEHSGFYFICGNVKMDGGLIHCLESLWVLLLTIETINGICGLINLKNLLNQKLLNLERCQMAFQRFQLIQHLAYRPIQGRCLEVLGLLLTPILLEAESPFSGFN